MTYCTPKAVQEQIPNESWRRAGARSAGIQIAPRPRRAGPHSLTISNCTCSDTRREHCACAGNRIESPCSVCDGRRRGTKSTSRCGSASCARAFPAKLRRFCRSATTSGASASPPRANARQALRSVLHEETCGDEYRHCVIRGGRRRVRGARIYRARRDACGTSSAGDGDRVSWSREAPASLATEVERSPS